MSNIFQGKFTNLSRIPALRLVNIYEDHVVSLTSLNRASQFVPKVSDIIVCSPPAAGGAHVADMIRLAVRASPPPVPGMCIESREGDRFPKWLSETKPDEPRRVFETHMTPLLCSPKRHPATYVVVLRHPLDLQLCFMHFIRELYNEGDPDFMNFDENYSLDDFMSVPISLCQLSNQMTYEQYITQWTQLSASHAATVCILFYEALLCEPKVQIARLLSCLHVSQDDALRLDLLINRAQTAPDKYLCGSGAAHCSRTSQRQVACRWTDEGLGSYESLFETMCAPTQYPFPQDYAPIEVMPPQRTLETTFKSTRKTLSYSARAVGSIASGLAKTTFKLAYTSDNARRLSSKEEEDDDRARAESYLDGHALSQKEWQMASKVPMRFSDDSVERLSSSASEFDTAARPTRKTMISEKFVTHTALEDKIIKEKLVKAKVRNSIVEVVAKGDALSEML